MRGGPYTLDCNITIMIPAGLHGKNTELISSLDSANTSCCQCESGAKWQPK